jgi:hypothetical protein
MVLLYDGWVYEVLLCAFDEKSKIQNWYVLSSEKENISSTSSKVVRSNCKLRNYICFNGAFAYATFQTSKKDIHLGFHVGQHYKPGFSCLPIRLESPCHLQYICFSFEHSKFYWHVLLDHEMSWIVEGCNLPKSQYKSIWNNLTCQFGMDASKTFAIDKTTKCCCSIQHQHNPYIPFLNASNPRSPNQ